MRGAQLQSGLDVAGETFVICDPGGNFANV